MFRKKRVYLDWAAATPLSKKAFTAMKPWLTSEHGNPSAIYQEGVRARAAVERARLQVARSLSVRPTEVFFGGSGTEVNNLAIIGYVRHLEAHGTRLSDIEIISTSIEHPSVTKVLCDLSERGVIVHQVQLDEHGVIDVSALTGLLNKRTKLLTFAYVNSEIGVVQPVKQITRLIRAHNKDQGREVRVHIDAAQAPLWLSCAVPQLGVDLMTLDAGKFCGPKGVGVLIKRSSCTLQPIFFGGGQEVGIRSGTENVAGIVGAAVALEIAQAEYTKRSEAVSAVRDQTLTHLGDTIAGVLLNGPTGETRVANNINISLPGLDTEYLAVWLDSKGFAVSTKSACSGAGGGESAVVKVVTGDAVRAASTLRVTLGPETTAQELDQLMTCISEHIVVMEKV